MSKTSHHFDVIVIGGGAAGMMAAGRAGERGRRVLLLEKNKRLGQKLSITGGGRCNITNAELNPRVLLKHYGQGEKPLYAPFSRFGVAETFSFFEKHGLPLIVEEYGRAFPQTQKASDVVAVLERYVYRHGVVVKTNAEVSKIILEQDASAQIYIGSEKFIADAIILATGGVSHPETGSTGDGFSWLKTFGHSVAAPTPGIVPLAVREAWVKRLSGVSMEQVKITFFLNDVKQFSRTGKILFTHFGLSGPMILNCAAQVGDLLHGGNVTAKIDLFPKEDEGALEQRLITLFDLNKNKSLKNIFKVIVQPGTAKEILSLLSDKVAETKVHSITKVQRKNIIRVLKQLPVTIIDLMGFDRAVVADGGLELKDIDTKTMRSRLCPQLFIIGDLLHITRPSGGYSLQLCWTTGYVAGSNA